MKLIDIFLAVIFIAIYSLDYLITAKCLEYGINPILFCGIKFALAFILIFTIISKKISMSDFLWLFLISIPIGILNYACTDVALNIGVPIHVVSILDQMAMPLSILVGVVILKEKVNIKQILGSIIAFSGAISIVIANSIHTDNIDNQIDILKIFMCISIIMGACSWSFYAIKGQAIEKRIGKASAIGYMSLAIAVQSFVASSIFETKHFAFLPNIDWLFITMILTSASLCVFVVLYLWQYLSLKYPISILGPFFCLIPVIGVLIDLFILHHRINKQNTISIFFVLLGLIIVFYNMQKTLDSITLSKDVDLKIDNNALEK